jgi:hypothetical protein
MMKNLLVFSLVFFVACATTGNLRKLELGMTKDEVVDKLGEPAAARGSMRNKYDQVIEVWEYQLVKPDDAAYHITTEYWMYFYSGKLVQWGEAGDWKREADRIYEIRYR